MYNLNKLKGADRYKRIFDGYALQSKYNDQQVLRNIGAFLVTIICVLRFISSKYDAFRFQRLYGILART